MFKLSKIENARMNVPEPEYLPVTASEAVSEGEALVLSNGALTKCGATATPTYIAMGSVAADAEDREIAVCRNGAGIEFSEEKAKEILLEKEIEILVNVGDGEGKAQAYGCDLTYDYVKINGDYRT